MSKLRLDEIDPKPAKLMRILPDAEAVEDYAKSLADLPPVRVGTDGEHYWLIDGRHRYDAHVLAGRDEIECQVDDVADYVEAYREACRANFNNNSVRVTNADKRFRVLMAINDPMFARKSNREIANICGCAHSFIATVKESLNPTVSVPAPPAPGWVKDHYDLSDKVDSESTLSDKADTPSVTTDAAAPDCQEDGDGTVPTPAPPSADVGRHEANGVHHAAPPAAPPTPGFDVEAAWAVEADLIRSRYMAWPEDRRMYYAFKLNGLLVELESHHPEIVDATEDFLP